MLFIDDGQCTSIPVDDAVIEPIDVRGLEFWQLVATFRRKKMASIFVSTSRSSVDVPALY